jgi:superfamily II DNA or RNA helicase
MNDLRRALDGCKQKYYSPKEDIVNLVLVPGVGSCKKFDCMTGYFSTSFLRELAHGLSQYLVNSDEPLRMLVSNEISVEDQQTLQDGVNSNEIAYAIVKSAFEDKNYLEDALVKHTKECLAYLVSQDRLQIKVVIKKNGMFHIKSYHFFYDDDIAVFSGSANATGYGMSVNDEQLSLHQSWVSERESESCSGDVEYFNECWNGRSDSITVELDAAIKNQLLKQYQKKDDPPTSDDYSRALLAFNLKQESTSFRIPSGLVWETGDFKHQGRAIHAWEAANRCGILAMATGSGKTLTSLIAAKRLSDEKSKLMILIAVPTRPLLRQWEQDVLLFGLQPYVADNGSSKDHLTAIDRKIQSLELGLSRVEVAIVTLNLLKNEKMRQILSSSGDDILLIADEMHNLGTEKFTQAPPNVRYKLGLSATPERQYDQLGTEALLEYFGNVVFEFSLDEAIGVCLVPYDYFLHEVELSPEEMEEYVELSRKIKRMMAINDGATDGVQRLLEKRAQILETAHKKIETLKQLLQAVGTDDIRHTLVYCSDKNRDQIVQVNSLLSQLGIKFHQVTAEESADRGKVKSILEQFRKKNTSVLTAMRILDEGFNIPEIATAFVLASNSVERQWTQRRGRVLRMCAEINKEYASIHDYIAVPPPSYEGDEDAAKLTEKELTRAKEFARICRNRDKANSPYIVIRDLEARFVIRKKESKP